MTHLYNFYCEPDYWFLYLFQNTPTAPQRQLSQTPSERDHKDDRLSTNNNIKISPIPTPSLQTPPSSPQQPTQSKRLLQEILSRPGPYPMIAVPPKGYWVDGTDHEEQYDHRGLPVIPHPTWRAKIETDDTAKCYRRFFVGRVSLQQIFRPLFFFIITDLYIYTGRSNEDLTSLL